VFIFLEILHDLKAISVQVNRCLFGIHS
jgi:hypothetical protein